LPCPFNNSKFCTYKISIHQLKLYSRMCSAQWFCRSYNKSKRQTDCSISSQSEHNLVHCFLVLVQCMRKLQDWQWGILSYERTRWNYVNPDCFSCVFSDIHSEGISCEALFCLHGDRYYTETCDCLFQWLTQNLSGSI
jgi:hypothetical protein